MRKMNGEDHDDVQSDDRRRELNLDDDPVSDGTRLVMPTVVDGKIVDFFTLSEQ